MKKLFLVAVVLAFFCPICYGEPAFYYQINQKTPVVFSCLDSDYFYCNSSTSCSITIFYPNQTTYIDSGTMTRTTTYYYYNITPTKTGTYVASANCQSGSENGFSTFEFEVTENGKENIDLVPSYIPFLIIGLILYIVLIVAFWKDDVYLGMIVSMAIGIFGTYTVFVGIGGLKNYLTDAFSIINMVIGCYIFLRASLEQNINIFGG